MAQHPITPPPELIEDWIEIAKPEPWKRPPDPNVLCTLAAQWGADQELEACCEWMADETPTNYINALRAARRSKPPSLKEQALALINHDSANQPFLSDKGIDTIRRALEQLPDNE